MTPIVIALALIAFLAVFAYVQWAPPYADPKLVRVFNRMVYGVVTFFCLTWVGLIYATWADGPDADWRAPLAIAGSCTIIIVSAVIFFLIRNFWIFARIRGNGLGL